MNEDVVDRLASLAERWDLQALHQEVIDVLAGFEASQRPYVPSQLVRALDMFLDSYGPNRSALNRS